jgi:hypothetical protein
LLYIVHALFLDSRGAAKLDDDRFKTQAYAKPSWPVTRGIHSRASAPLPQIRNTSGKSDEWRGFSLVFSPHLSGMTVVKAAGGRFDEANRQDDNSDDAWQEEDAP